MFFLFFYIYEMMVFTKLIVGIIPCKSNHYAVHLKLMFVLHVNDISMKREKLKGYFKEKRSSIKQSGCCDRVTMEVAGEGRF